MITEVLLFRPKKKQTLDIIKLCESVEIKGDIESCARECHLTTMYPFRDKNHEKVFPSIGDIVYVNEGRTNLFFGMVMDRTLSMDERATFVCYDPIIHLTQSYGTFNFKKAKPEDIARTVAKSAGMNIENLAATGITIDLICENLSFYEIIMQAYTKASIKNGKQYIPKMRGSKFNVIEKGSLNSDLVLSLDANITNFEYNSNILDMVNKVAMYNDSGKFLGSIQIDDWVNSFGVFQQVVQKEEGKDIKAQARALIHGSTSTLSIEALGISSCQTGHSVRVVLPYIDVTRNQNMFIDGDTHTYVIGSGLHTMQLNLNFENKMDRKEND